MSQKFNTHKYDPINNRILVRNSHKFVYKKLCNLNRDQWCQKYLSVATSKLLDPKNTAKLPFSLNKKHKTQQSTSSASNTSFCFHKQKTRVLAIHDSNQLCKSRTIDNDTLIQASRKAEKLLQQMRQTVMKPPVKFTKSRGKKHMQPSRYQINHETKSRDSFDIQPWMVDSQECDQKQNRFY